MRSRPDFWTVVSVVFILVLSVYWIVDYLQFRHAGKRFTAADGQALCKRIQKLEEVPKPCLYLDEDYW